MKKRIIRMSSVLCVVFMLFSFVTVYADKGENGQKLYEKYGYNEKFEYNATSVGFALRSAVPMVETILRGTVEYQPVVFDEQKFIATFEELYEKYGIETEEEKRNLIALLLEDLQKNTLNYLSYGSKKRTEAEGGGSGSGIVISEDGYVATNSHVVTFTDEEKKIAFLGGLQKEIVDDVAKIVEAIGEYNVSFSEDETYDLYEVILMDAADKMKIIDEEICWNVYFPSADGKTSVEDAVVYEAEVVKEGTQYDLDGFTEDAAILKIDAKNLVALKFSEDYPDLNEPIISAGFPGDADDIFVKQGSTESVLSIFSSAGTVSRLAPVEGSSYQAIGLNTTISNGSSGGPSVDMQLNIEGLNTYGDAEDKRFAYMVPAAFLNDLTKGIELKQGDVTKTFLTGIQLLQNNYGPAALECFKSVASRQPDTPYIDEMIKKAENAPKNEYKISGVDDGNAFVDFLEENWIFIAGGAFVLIVLVLAVVLIVKRRKKKASKQCESERIDGMPTYANVGQSYEGVRGRVQSGSTNANPSDRSYTAPMQVTPEISVPKQVSGNSAENYVSPMTPTNAEITGEKVASERPVLRSTMPKPKMDDASAEMGKAHANEAFSRASDLD